MSDRRMYFQGPDFRNLEERKEAVKGLTQRLEERRIRNLPAKAVRWVEER